MYKNKKRKIQDDVVKRAAQFLTLDELAQLTYKGINEAIGVWAS